MRLLLQLLSKVNIKEHGKYFSLVGKILKIATSYAILLPLVGAALIVAYWLLPPVRNQWLLNHPQAAGLLIAVTVSIIIYGGFILSLKIALSLIGINLSKDLETNLTQASQGMATLPKRENGLQGGTSWASAKQITALKTLIIILGLALLILTIYQTLIR